MFKNCQKSIQVFIAICLILQTGTALANFQSCPRFYGVKDTISFTSFDFEGSGGDGKGGGSGPSSGNARMDALARQIIGMGKKGVDYVKIKAAEVGPDTIYKYKRDPRVLLREDQITDFFSLENRFFPIDKSPGGIRSRDYLIDSFKNIDFKKISTLAFESGDYARVLAQEVLLGGTKITKISETEGSHLKPLGFGEEPLPVEKSDPVMVIGDGFSGNIASTLRENNFTKVTSVDTIYTEANVQRWNKKHPEDKIALEEGDVRGNAKDLKHFGEETQALVLAHNLLPAIKPGDIGKVIGSVTRVLQVGAQARLSFGGKGSRVMRDHLELVARASEKKDKAAKLTVVITDAKKNEGYLLIEKVRSTKGGSDNADGDVPSFSGFALLLIEKIKTSVYVEKIAEKLPNKNLSTFEAKRNTELTMFDSFLELFIEPHYPNVRENPAQLKSLMAYFHEKIYTPIVSGRTLEAALNLRYLEGADIANVLNEGYTIIQKTVSGLKVHVLAKVDDLNNLEVFQRIKNTTLTDVSCNSAACLDAVQNLAKPSVEAALKGLKGGFGLLRKKLEK